LDLSAALFHEVNVTRRFRPARLSWLLCLGVLWIAVGCSSSEKQSPPGPPPVPQTLSFPAVDGAASYRVRAWSGYRLLFEQTVTDTQFTVTPSLARSMRPFDDVQLEVQPFDLRGHELGHATRVPVQRPSEP
jgi:hypothetical protein